MKTLNIQVCNKGQSSFYEEIIELWPNPRSNYWRGRIQIEIDHSYSQQSRNGFCLWSNGKWEEIAEIPYPLLKTSFNRFGTEPTAGHFAEDRNRLIEMAKLIIGTNGGAL